MSFFQYIIGNQDWFITSAQNVVVMQPNDSTMRPFSVPFDFDFSNFIHAFYTKTVGLPDSLDIRIRLYKGLCLTTNEFIAAIDYFNNMEHVFKSIINNKKLLSQETREKLLAYIEEYYIQTENEGMLISVFQNECLEEEEYYFTNQ